MIEHYSLHDQRRDANVTLYYHDYSSVISKISSIVISIRVVRRYPPITVPDIKITDRNRNVVMVIVLVYVLGVSLKKYNWICITRTKIQTGLYKC